MRDFTVGLTTRRGTAVLVPSGELDITTAPGLRLALERLPRETERVVVDMAGVPFMDVAGLHFLSDLRRHGRRHRRPVRAVRWCRQPRRLLVLTGTAVDSGVRDTAYRVHRVVHHPDGGVPKSADRGGAWELARLQEENEQLKQAIDRRPVVDQARGVVMAVGRCTAAQAWQALLETSQRTNTKMRDVARAVVSTTTGTELAEPLRSALWQAVRRARSHRPPLDGT